MSTISDFLINHPELNEEMHGRLVVERLLKSSIVPYSLSSQERMIQLYYAYTKFDDFSKLNEHKMIFARMLSPFWAYYF